jgi:hypothetical protein
VVLTSAMGTLACQGPVDAGPTGSEVDPAGMNEQQAVASCPLLPTSTDPQSVRAYDRINMYRRAMGLPCANFVPEIALAAARHCAYYAGNHGTCIDNPHREVKTCDKFRGERFSDRLKVAGYSGTPAYEVMTYIGDGGAAVDQWVDSIWHRIPILDPYVGDVGYGMDQACDTMDFGWGTTAPTNPVVYPYDTQTGLPTSFDGDVESPPPPRPPKGWPGGYPLIVYAASLTVQTHRLLDDKGLAIAHTFITPDHPAGNGLLINEVVMYADLPLKNKTTYRVVIDGQQRNVPIHLEWTFTTR